MSTITDHSAPAGTDSLRAELARIEAGNPGWRVRTVAETGMIRATHLYTRTEQAQIEAALTERERSQGCHAGSGVTLPDCRTPAGIAWAIAGHKAAWARALRNAGVAA